MDFDTFFKLAIGACVVLYMLHGKLFDLLLRFGPSRPEMTPEEAARVLEEKGLPSYGNVRDLEECAQAVIVQARATLQEVEKLSPSDFFSSEEPVRKDDSERG